MAIKLIKIGRSPENDVVIDDTSVSRFHLEIFQDEEGTIFISDLKSTNGTTVNGDKLTGSKILKKKDVVKVGKSLAIPWTTYFTDAASTPYKAPANQINNAPDTVKRKRKPIAWTFGLLTLTVVMGYLYMKNPTTSVHTDNKRVHTPIKVQDQDQSFEGEKKKETSPKTDKKISKPQTEQPKRDIPLPSSSVITYSYTCMDQGLINTFSDMETDFIDGSGELVTLSEERKAGQQLYEGCKKEYTFINDKRLQKIKTIKNRLQKVIKNKRGFNYTIYLLKDEMINAFTAGGYIFVTTGMMSFVKNDDELACVIGHEMAHNECKHINQQLKKVKVNQAIFGDVFGNASASLNFFVTASFNQKKETECDFHGIDYAVNANYNSCAAINLWKRMSEQDAEGDKIDEMMRTHPYSSKRSLCCKNHIETNYGFVCP